MAAGRVSSTEVDWFRWWPALVLSAVFWCLVGLVVFAIVGCAIAWGDNSRADVRTDRRIDADLAVDAAASQPARERKAP